MKVLAGVKYKFTEVQEKISICFSPPKTGSYEIVCNSNRLLQVKIHNEECECFLPCKTENLKFEYRYAQTLLYKNQYYLQINVTSEEDAEKDTNIEMIINTVLEPSSTMFKYQWGLLNKKNGLDINVLPLWKYVKKTSMNIGIADTGINYNHCCLKNSINSDLAYDFIEIEKEYTNDYCVDKDHGTGIAGVIAAVPQDVHGIWGITENPNIVSLKIFEKIILIKSNHQMHLLKLLSTH